MRIDAKGSPSSSWPSLTECRGPPSFVWPLPSRLWPPEEDGEEAAATAADKAEAESSSRDGVVAERSVPVVGGVVGVYGYDSGLL